MKKIMLWSAIALIVGAAGGFFGGQLSRDEYVVISTARFPVKMNKRTGDTWELVQGKWRQIGIYYPSYPLPEPRPVGEKPNALDELLKATEPK